MGKIKNLEVYEGMLVIVDMVNGFIKDGVLHDDAIAEVIPRQIELIKEARSKGYLVVFVKDTHDPNATEFKRFGDTKHTVRGTSEADVVSELKSYEEEDDTISIEKNSTSYMEAPSFRDLVQKMVNLKKVEVAGCCTDICVFNGTMGLANYFDEHNRDVEISVHTDAVKTYSEESRAVYVNAALLLMAQQGIQLVKKR